MGSAEKSRKDLLNEIEALRSRVRELEAAAERAGSDSEERCAPSLDTSRNLVADIDSEPARVTQALCESSEERYRALAEEVPVLICRFLPDGEIAYLNKRFCECFGKAPEELTGSNIVSLLSEAEWEDALVKASALIVESPTRSYEYRVVNAAGEVCWQHWTARALFDAQGRVTSYQAIGEDITERKRAEDAQRSSEEKYRKLFEESVAAVYLLDNNRRLVDANQAGLALLGYSKDELYMLDVADVDADPEVVLPIRDELLGGTAIVNYEHQLKRKDGRIITVLNNSQPLTDSTGDVIGMQSTLVEITDRKHAEATLRESESRFRSLYENSPYGIVVCRLIRDAEGRAIDFVHLRVNSATTRHFGTPMGDLEGKKISEVIPQGYSAEPVERYAEVVATGSPASYTQRFPMYGRVLDVTAFALSGDEFILSFHDITSRVQAEERLEKSRQRLRTIIDAVPSMIFVKNAEGRFLAANEAGARAYGMRPQELVGKLQADVVSDPEEARRLLQNDRRVLESGTGFTAAGLNYVAGSGTVGKLQVIVVPCPEGDFGEPAVLAVAMDITELEEGRQQLSWHRDHLEELVAERTLELEESKAALLQAERLASLGTLAAGIAHQINNPLAAILNGVQFALLSEDAPDVSAVWKRALVDAEEQARRCGSIVRSILQFSRNERAEKWRTGVNEVVRRACDVTAGYAARSGAGVEFDMSHEDARVWMSPIEMEQALVNLIRNGVESRKIGAKVMLRTWCTPTTACIEVRDNGRGITSEVGKQLFDPFFTTRLSDGGTGLGLSVAHGIILDHRGTIGFESEEGRGTVFTIELPLDVEG